MAQASGKMSNTEDVTPATPPATTELPKSESELEHKPLAAAVGGLVAARPVPKVASVTHQRKKPTKPTSTSRIFHLFSHVPPYRILRTVLTEMEEELRKSIPGAKKKLRNHGQDIHVLTDIREYGDSCAVEEFNEIIEKAKESIAIKAQDKIQTNDTILIYGYSEVIRDTLLAAIDNGKKFSLIIVEGSLGYKTGADKIGQEALTQNGGEIHALHMMKYLGPKIKNGSVAVTYIHLNGLSFVIRTVTKFFMTAYALLTNGGVLGRIGTAQVALMAHKKNIPVVVCCETFKFCDKSPVDSFFQNERGHLNIPDKKNKPTPAHDDVTEKLSAVSIVPKVSSPRTYDQSSKSKPGIQENAYLKAPILKYDITPAKFVTAVITEVDVFPAQSIPLLLQVQESRNKNRGKGSQEGVPLLFFSSLSSGSTESSPEKA